MKNTLLSILALMGLCSVPAMADDASTLDFKKEGLTAAAAAQAINDLNIELGQCKAGVYNMRGGKENGVPEAHSYQYSYNLDTDNYCQYFVITHHDFPYAAAEILSTYNICEQFNGAGHSNYNLTKAVIPGFLTNANANLIPEIKAIYLLYFDLVAQENADISGPFTYEEDKQNSDDPRKYNSVRDIYYAIKADIDNCIACWTYFDENRDADYKAVITRYAHTNSADKLADMMDKYDEKDLEHFFDNYIRLANSLQLRMAMHMSKIEPATAQAWAEEAISRGVIEKKNQQQGVCPSTMSFTHPLVEIAGSWADTRMSASFESLLMSLDHPYTKYLFKPNANAIENLETLDLTEAGSRIVGIRSGEHTGEGQAAGSNPFINYSTFDPLYVQSTPLYFVSLKEVLFLRAEGALRGWEMGGTAQHFYEEGIRVAGLEDPLYEYYEYDPEEGMAKFSNYVEDYLKVETPREYTQVDPQGLGEPWPSVTKIGVTWKEDDANETKLEKIITQKYIALWPDSHEAWTELRRTGYPALFPVLNASDGDGSIKQGDMIRRVPYRFTDPVQLGYWEATGLPALGGPDMQATRLWWDVEGRNFPAEEGIRTATTTATSGKTFMLDGRVCNGATRGIVIMNNKKVIR